MNPYISEEHISSFSKHLKPVLEAELKAGNSICETSKGWPLADTIMIFLAQPFKAPRFTGDEQVEYIDTNDPHYWKAEYRDKRTGHVLACKFG
jgi:hypothetical protein